MPKTPESDVQSPNTPAASSGALPEPPPSRARRQRRSRKTNTLTREEVSLVKAMLADASLNDQDILAYFTRPGRTVNHARIAEIWDDNPGHRSVAAATPARLTRFLADWPQYDQHRCSIRHPVTSDHLETPGIPASRPAFPDA